ncbi:MAG: hypothetical protein DCC71_07765 [Proteobacteria bacterium]|nr:MAG: hypothetical protein DCC71_07765 [Pseudomonadota bacterium]
MADRPGTDSHRSYESRARAVALLSSEPSVTLVRRRKPPAVDTALAALPADLDRMLVEGFSWEPIPRVVVTGPGREHRAASRRRSPMRAMRRAFYTGRRGGDAKCDRSLPPGHRLGRDCSR